MNDTDRIDLAHTSPFALGRLAVRPGTRQLLRDDGESEVLEPRVMQVLVALARADGAIVTREELGRWCWDDRIVGEDAINRVLSRLRRSAEGIGEGSFRIETITKVGYRLVRPDRNSDSPPVEPAVPRTILDRRKLVAGAVGLAAVAVGGGAFLLWPRHAEKKVPPQVAAMMQAGLNSVRQITGEADLQARGIFRRVTEMAPDYADGWGSLARVYAAEVHYHPARQTADLTARAKAAIAQARRLDPDNLHAEVAEVMLLPNNDWRGNETGLRRALARAPDDDLLLQLLGRALARVGRMNEAADALERAVTKTEASAITMFDLMSWQWAAGRADQADRTIERALGIFPRHFAVWFGSFYIRLFSGRIDDAIAMAENVDGRPASVPDSEIVTAIAIARALRSRDPAAVSEVRAGLMARARLCTGYAENAMQHLSAFGLADDAMTIAEAYFLSRGFEVPSMRFPVGQGTHTRMPDRRTWFLFYPVSAPLRAHPRFGALVEAIGLERYWRESGKPPDYRK